MRQSSIRVKRVIPDHPALSEDDLPVVLLFVALATLAFLTPPQADTFFHLRTGELIWRSGAIPSSDPFSHTFYGQPWLNHEWLSQLLFYGVYALGGPFLLTALCGACAVVAVMASWRLTRGAAEVRLGLLLALLILTPSEWAVRPQALSLALLMLATWLVIRDKVVWMPVLVMVWANAHGVAVLGVAVACVAALEAIVWPSSHRRRAVIVAALCLAAPMATPLGWHYWPRVFQTVSEARLLGVHEYRSAFADASSVPFWLMLVVLVGAVARQARRIADWERPDRLLVMASCVLGVAAILSIRNAPSFALLAAPAIARLTHLPRPRQALPLKRAGYAFIGVAAAIGLVVVGMAWRDGGTRRGWRPVSPSALKAISDCSPPIYNEYGDGGTLIWFTPEQRVFVDGRIEAYTPEFLRRARDADVFGRYQDLFRQYGIRCAVTRTGSVMARVLQQDVAMTKQFGDERWSVFER